MTFLFLIFSALTLAGGIGVVVNRNPVSSAFSLIVSFLGLAALFIQLNAFLVGVLQVLVYTGAVMVLFVFIIMLLDIREAEKRRFPAFWIAGSGVIAGAFALLLVTVVSRSEFHGARLPALVPVEGPGSSDVHQIGNLLFGVYWLPVQIVAVLLLTATVGVVILSRKELR